jgi:signal transduction histidine kinase
VSLRARLALLQAIVLAFGLALLGALLVESLERSLLAEADEILARRAGEVEAEVRSVLARGLGEAGVSGIPLDPDTQEEFATPGLYVAVLRLDGRQLGGSRALPAGGLPGRDEALADAARGRSRLETLTVGEEHVRVLSVPVLLDGQPVAVVRVGESLAYIESTVRGLVRLLAVGGSVVLVAALVATWIVVSRALDPLVRIATTAERIALTGDVHGGVEERTSGEVERLRLAFNRMVERVRRVLDGQRQLLADTSHELRNPLTVIRTNLDLLSCDLDPATREEVVAETSAEAERMTRLVADLLFLSREEADAVEHAPVRLDAVARETVVRFRQLAPDHVLTLDAPEPLVVLGDRDRLRQLLTNLIENAVRFTPPGGRVAVAARRLDVAAHAHGGQGAAGPGRAELVVQDTGIGIPAEHLSRVFDRFYRVDPARNRATGGTGLGLAIVKRIAESHGGDVRVESQPGHGARFTVTLPLAEAGPDAAAAAPADEAAADAPALRR